MEDELYSKHETAAFQRVDEFLCWFAMLESNIDESIINLLGLEPAAGRLLMAYVPFQKKCEFLEELIGLEEVEFTSQEMKTAKQNLKQTRGKGTIRNIVAHSFFVGHEAGGVKFLKAEKKLQVDISRTIDDDQFRKHRNEMADLWGWVAQITHRIKMKMKMNQRQVAQALEEKRAIELTERFFKPH